MWGVSLAGRPFLRFWGPPMRELFNWERQYSSLDCTSALKTRKNIEFSWIFLKNLGRFTRMLTLWWAVRLLFLFLGQKRVNIRVWVVSWRWWCVLPWRIGKFSRIILTRYIRKWLEYWIWDRITSLHQSRVEDRKSSLLFLSQIKRTSHVWTRIVEYNIFLMRFWTLSLRNAYKFCSSSASVRRYSAHCGE
jgi:hypothetical protein